VLAIVALLIILPCGTLFARQGWHQAGVFLPEE
jgi:hypothetical protein